MSGCAVPAIVHARRFKAALVSVAYSASEMRQGGDPVELANAAADILQDHLDRDERGWLLMVTAQAAEPIDLEALAIAIVESAGPPVPALSDIRAEARDWAGWASSPEIRAYLAACWHRLPKKDRASFLKAARKVTA